MTSDQGTDGRPSTGSGRTVDDDVDGLETTVRTELVEDRGPKEEGSPSPRPSPIKGEGETEEAAHAYHEDFEVQIYNAVKWRREHSEGLPGEETIFAMEEPVCRLMKSSILFCDLAECAVGSGSRPE